MAKRYGWVKPPWEVAFLLRDYFTKEKMADLDDQTGVWYIVTAHKSVAGSSFMCSFGRQLPGRIPLLGFARPDDGFGISPRLPDSGRWVPLGQEGGRLLNCGGFAFIVPQN